MSKSQRARRHGRPKLKQMYRGMTWITVEWLAVLFIWMTCVFGEQDVPNSCATERCSGLRSTNDMPDSCGLGGKEQICAVSAEEELPEPANRACASLTRMTRFDEQAATHIDVDYESGEQPAQLYARVVNESRLLDILRASSALAPVSTSVLEVGDERKPARSARSNSHEFVLVNFHATGWCRFSQAFESTYALLAASFPELCVLSIDAYHNAAFNSRFGAHAFPSVILFHAGEPLFRYRGNRTVDSLASWLRTRITDLSKHREPHLQVEEQVSRFYNLRAKARAQLDDAQQDRFWPFKLAAAIISVLGSLICSIRLARWCFEWFVPLGWPPSDD
ncbi:Thioredoxin domain-containing protein 15 [Porphyridium purpureum]|uniref:Thioredoxin domain-containing protein 15 n=1 Tax=Porphyridium purpureum TaxID=35688 RepID=A0A5J4Z0W1_PORPP|nr:Thioredoxin domain-containing protein 15 [Porphyridium purpureum]|eukprot:POR2184..scf208_2